MDNKFLSIVIPAYNEEKRIGETLLSLEEYFKSKKITHEVIVVSDGSTDKTAEIVSGFQKKNPNFFLINNIDNLGKGHAVNCGMKKARGDYRLFMDADNSVRIDFIESFLEEINNGADVVVGSISLSGSKIIDHNVWYRRIVGIISKFIIKFVAMLDVNDTQRGFKLFTRAAAEKIFPLQTIWRFGFDIELLVIAKAQGLKIKELPIEWHNPSGSTVRFIDYIKTFEELLKIAINKILGIYNLKSIASKKTSWAVISILVLITGVAAFLRFHLIGKLSLWSDEIVTVIAIGHSIQDMLMTLWPKEINMSFYYLMLHFWTKLFSNPGEDILRTFSALFSVVSVPAVFLLGRTINKDKRIANTVGIISALLITFNSFHIQYAQELRSYSLVFLLTVLSTLLFIKAVEKRDSWKYWAGYTFVSVLAIYSHYFVAFLIFAQVFSLSVLYFGKRYSLTYKLQYKKIVTSYFVMALLIVPVAITPLFAGTGGLSWIARPNLHLLLQFAIKIAGNHGVPLLLLYAAAGIAGLFFLIKSTKEDVVEGWVSVLFLTCLLLPVVVAILISEIYKPIFYDRYFMFVMPFMAIFSAVGIAKLISMKPMALKFIGILILGLMIVISTSGIQSYYKNFKKEDWRGVSKFLALNCGATEDLQFYYPAWTQSYVSYYTDQLEIKDEAVKKVMTNSSTDNISPFITKNNTKICLVRGENSGPRFVSQVKSVETALQVEYPKLTQTKFYRIEVDILSK